MPQTAVEDRMTPGIVGQVATAHGMADASMGTATSEEETAGIPVGRFVVQGAADDGALLPSAQADVLKGVACFSHEFERSTELNDDLDLAPGTTFGVLLTGPVTVAPTTAAAPGDEVHVQMVAEGGHPAGAVRATASVNKTVDISAFARWRTTAASGGDKCILEIDMTNAALAAADGT